MSEIEHDRWRIEPSKEGIPLVFGDGKYPHDPPRIASELESSLAAAYAGAVEERDRLRTENERLREALAHVINRVSTERRDDEHGHIFAVGKAALTRSNDAAPSVPELVERSRALGPVMEAQGDVVAQGLRDAADRVRDEGGQ